MIGAHTVRFALCSNAFNAYVVSSYKDSPLTRYTQQNCLISVTIIIIYLMVFLTPMYLSLCCAHRIQQVVKRMLCQR